MKYKSLAVQLVAVGLSVTPAVYVGMVHSNLLESIISYIIVLGLSSVIFKKWYIVLNVATFLAVLTLVILIGGTL